MAFEPYKEGADTFEMAYEGFKSRLYSDKLTGHQKFVPAPDEALLARFYNGAFIRSADGLVSAEREFTPRVMTFANDLSAKAIKLGVRDDFLAFDVGCGFGALVHAFLQMGVDAYGNEANRAWVEAANPYCNNRLSVDPLAPTLDRIGRKVDLFSVYHVLEHLADPLETLKILACHLSDTGIIDIQVPNAQSIRVMVGGRRYDPQFHFPQHLHYFSPASMLDMLRQAGLEPISLYTRPLFENGYDGTPAGWEASLGVPSQYVIDKEAWAEAASANLLTGELRVLAALPSNTTATREPDIDHRAEQALCAFHHGRAEAQRRVNEHAFQRGTARMMLAMSRRLPWRVERELAKMCGTVGLSELASSLWNSAAEREP